MTEKQEIDLFEIFIYIFRIFKKRKFYILTFFLVGIVFGYLSSYKVNKIYEQTSICEERVVGNEIIGKIINEFNDKLINENTHESFLPLIENEVKFSKGKKVKITIPTTDIDEFNYYLKQKIKFQNAEANNIIDNVY